MILFLIFILCSVFTILIGSRVYQNIRTRNDDSFYTGTAMAYISNKVRQSDAADSIGVQTIDGLPVLVLTRRYGDICYETWIYTKNGSLMELYAEQGSGFSTDDGLVIMDCASVDFSIGEEPGGEYLTITLSGQPEPVTGYLSLRSGKEDGSHE